MAGDKGVEKKSRVDDMLLRLPASPSGSRVYLLSCCNDSADSSQLCTLCGPLQEFLNWLESPGPWPATHYLLEQPTKGSPRLSFWPCHRTTVLSPASFGQPVEQARYCIWLCLFRLSAQPCFCSLTSTQNFWRRISSACDRTPNKEIPSKRGRYEAKMGPYQNVMGNHWMGHGF